MAQDSPEERLPISDDGAALSRARSRFMRVPPRPADGSIKKIA
jgi:hypothetical protein